MKMELKMVPTVQMDINLVPATRLVNYISSALHMHPSERLKDKLTKSLKGWEYILRTKRRGGITLNKENFDKDIILRQIAPNFEKERALTDFEAKDYLKRIFINSYYTFNFVALELGLTGEIGETREKFLEVMSSEPYLLVSGEKQPIGLNLYHRYPSEEPLEYEDYAVPTKIGLVKLINHTAEPTYYDTAFQKQINTLASDAVRESSSREKIRNLGSQLNLLIAGFINPKMFGVALEDYLEKSVPKLYKKRADVNGDFEMPLPKCLD